MSVKSWFSPSPHAAQGEIPAAQSLTDSMEQQAPFSLDFPYRSTFMYVETALHGVNEGRRSGVGHSSSVWSAVWVNTIILERLL